MTPDVACASKNHPIGGPESIANVLVLCLILYHRFDNTQRAQAMYQGVLCDVTKRRLLQVETTEKMLAI